MQFCEIINSHANQENHKVAVYLGCKSLASNHFENLKAWLNGLPDSLVF